jgi:alkaline phosphatase
MRFKKHLSKSIIFAIIAVSIFMVYVSDGNSANLGPKNIIIMISDGCGYNQIDAASIYQHGKSGAQIYHQFPIQFWVSTFESGGSYDSNKAWSQFGYVQGGYTDSSAAATAMSTGFKTYNAGVGVNPDRKPLKHLLQRAKEMGKAAGVITSVEISHATPAGFVAHNESRNNYEQIAQEMILDSKADVIMGCGNPMFNDNSQPAQNTYMYIGGKAVWDGLLKGITGYDLNGDGTVDNMLEDTDGDNAPDAWTLIQELSMFRQLMTGPTPKRVIGIAQAHTTLQQARSASDFNKNVPNLVEMSKAALNVLDNNPKGIFLMIEGGAIDWAAHSNQSLRMIEEEIDFSNAVQAVVEWVELNSNWNETLVIVTGDHETGYLTGPDSGPGPDWKPLVNNGAGKLPGMKWNSGNHTNSLLPLFAKGAGSNVFTKYADNVDPVRGAYIDNTEIAQAVFELMDLPVANVDVVSVGSQGKKATTLGKVKYDSLQSALLQNYPNPFNPETWIPFQLEEDTEVKIVIYNTIGELIRKIDLGQKSTGIYINQDRAVYWDGKNEVGEQVTSGIYFYTIHAGKYTATGKMLMVK